MGTSGIRGGSRVLPLEFRTIQTHLHRTTLGVTETRSHLDGLITRLRPTTVSQGGLTAQRTPVCGLAAGPLRRAGPRITVRSPLLRRLAQTPRFSSHTTLIRSPQRLSSIM